MSTLALGCIADDFTGATDLANNLVRAGFRTVQINGVPEAGLPVDATDAVVIALKTRTVPAAEAVAQSLQCLSWLQAQGVAQVYFKYCSTFDSTPLGNIGPVGDALLDVLAPEGGIAVVCPAFPENGRSVYQGHLFVGAQLLSDSGMRQHPLTPMHDANLLRVLQAQTPHAVGLVAWPEVRRGSEAVRARLAALAAQGVRWAVVDALDEADLRVLGQAVQGMPLVTGASGIALGLTGPLGHPSGPVSLPDWPTPRGRQAVLSGSCSVATRAQVRHFMGQGGAACRIDALDWAQGRQNAAQVLAWVAAQDPSKPVLVYATADPEAVQIAQQRLGVARAGQVVEAALSEVAEGLGALGIGQLVVAGGETSGAVVQQLGVRQMRIGVQIDPGVPWTVVQSPLWSGQALHLALKSGNFGAEDFFTRAFRVLAGA